jgi:ribonuclease VapC
VTGVIVDSSALMALVNGEPEAERLAQRMAEATCRMSVGTWIEVMIVADSRSASLGARLDEIITSLPIERVPLTERQADVARAAYRRYGKGSGSPARLNFGDCFAYALSVTAGEPLLFVGNDFAATDVAAVRLG